jgi:hypothetical protein
MDLRGLDHDERLALVALVEWVLKSDNRTTEREFEEFGRVVEAVGDDAYQALADEVATRFTDDADLRAFLPAVTRQDARELIFTTILDVAIADGVDVHESELLAWLADLWGIEIEFEDEP